MPFLATIPAWVGVAASAVGTGVAVAGAVQQADIAKSTAEYNAKLGERAALDNDEQAREQSMRARVENKRLLSAQRAGYAASGVQVDEGTPLEVQAQTAAILELQQMDDQKAAVRRSQSLLAGADADRAYGSAAASGYRLQAAGSLFSGIAGASSMASKAGLFGTKGAALKGGTSVDFGGAPKYAAYA